MSILDAIRKLFGGEEIPEEAERIYELSKDESDALSRLEEERGRSDRHRRVIIGDIDALAGEEELLVEMGKEQKSPIKRRILAKQVVEIRGKTGDLMNRVDILTRRIGVFDRQVALLRDRAVLDAPLPERGEIESAAANAHVAKEKFTEISELSDLHRDVSRVGGTLEGERSALREFDGESEEDVSFEEMLREEEGRLGRRDDDDRQALKE